MDALVVGAGPTGLLMAAELARHGLRVRVIDRDEHGATVRLGDYFGNAFSGSTSVSSFVSTSDDDGTNPAHRQQQVVAEVTIPS